MTDAASASDSDRTAATVFFSYSRTDQAKAVALIRLIEAAGFVTWWDGLLGGGERYSRATEAALDRARAVVVLWSKNSVDSHWVRDEATRGRDRGQLVPLSLDGTEPPLGFGQFQTITLAKAAYRANDAAIGQMIQAIAALHDRSVVTPQAPKAKAPILSRRAALAGGLGVVTLGGGVAAWKLLGGGRSAPGNSIAVLPFDNLSGDPAQQYFSDGLAAEIRAQLARNALLETAGQTSSSQFRDATTDARSVAKKLGVAFLLQGTVQKMADQLRVATFLIDGKTGTNVWSDVYERRLADVFGVQSEIAGAVTRELSVTIDARQPRKGEVEIGGTASLAAYDAFLRGRDLFEAHVDEAGDRAALAKFEQAIALDPNYAAARAARSRSLAVIANQYATANMRRQLYADAVAEARRATTLAPQFAPGFAALGYALFYGQLDVAAARAPYDRAFALAPNEVDVLSRYAVYCARTGRKADAEGAITRAAALDPLNSTMFKSAGNIKYAAGDYRGAIESTRKALALNPERSTLHGDIGNALLMLDDIDAAEAEFLQERNNLLALPGQAIIAHRRKQPAEAAKHLAALIAEYGDNSLYQQAQIAAQGGANDAALTALEAAYAASDSGMVYLRNDPFLNPLRNAPRFTALLRKMKFV